MRYKVCLAGGSKNGLPRTLCGQNQTFIIRDTEGIPCDGQDSQPSGEDKERRRVWGCPCCRMASHCIFQIIFLLKTNLIEVQIEDDAKNKGSPNWVNFKRVIWHASFYKLLESIEHLSKVGYWVECGDGVKRHIFPLILILAADYEEQ